MPFRFTTLQIPNMRTDYSGETRAFEQLGQTLGNLIPDIQKQQRANAEREEMTRLGKGVADGTIDLKQAAGRAIALGRADLGMELLKQGEVQQQRKLGLEATQSLGAAFGEYFGGAPSVQGLGASPTASTRSTSSALSPSLISNESGGNWQAQNNEVGAGGARGHFGRGQFGVARIQEAANAGAIPQGTTPQQFMQSPELQQAAERWHVNDIDANIRANGFDRLVGQRINGVPITIEGLRAVAHLGGVNGMKKFVETQGGYNPSDANGTSLFDYFSRHGGTRSAEADMPDRNAAVAAAETGQDGFVIPPGGGASMSGRTFQQIAGSMDSSPLRPAFEAEGVRQPWMGTALAQPQRALGSESYTAQVMPPRRPYDLNEADLPARGAVPAIGQMPPPAAARYAEADPTRDDAGMRIGQLVSEEARRGLPSGAGIMNPLDNFRSQPQQAPDQGRFPVPAPTGGDWSSVPAGAGSAATAATANEAQGPILTKDMPRPTNRAEALEYRATAMAEKSKGDLSKIFTLLANPNLPANAREVGQMMLRETLEQRKVPENVKEFMYARGMGWTTAKNPAEYAAEKEKAKDKGPTSVQEYEYAQSRGYKGSMLDWERDKAATRKPAISASDQKAIFAAEDELPAIDNTISTLSRALELNRQAYTGTGAAQMGQLGSSGLPLTGYIFDQKKSMATREFGQIMGMESIQAMSKALKGATTDREMGEFQKLLADPTTPPDIRERTINRMLTLAQRQKGIAEGRIDELRGRAGLEPRRGAAPTDQRQAAPQQPRQSVSAPRAAVEFLKANPGARDQFDAKYGRGAAASVLGQ